MLFRSVPIDQCAFLCATGSCEEAKLLHQADQWASGMRAPRGSGALLGPITLLCLLIAASTAMPAHLSAEPFAGKDWNASVTVDLGRKKPISPMLYGIFFEEVGRGGFGRVLLPSPPASCLPSQQLFRVQPKLKATFQVRDRCYAPSLKSLRSRLSPPHSHAAPTPLSPCPLCSDWARRGGWPLRRARAGPVVRRHRRCHRLPRLSRPPSSHRSGRAGGGSPPCRPAAPHAVEGSSGPQRHQQGRLFEADAG